jgi:pilus assembly protein Flp/PilA
VFDALLTRTGAALQSRLVTDEKGATAVEYGLIVGLIAVAIIATVGLLGGTLNGMIEAVNDELTGP